MAKPRVSRLHFPGAAALPAGSNTDTSYNAPPSSKGIAGFHTGFPGPGRGSRQAEGRDARPVPRQHVLTTSSVFRVAAAQIPQAAQITVNNPPSWCPDRESQGPATRTQLLGKRTHFSPRKSRPSARGGSTTHTAGAGANASCCHPWRLAPERDCAELNERSVLLGPRRSALAPPRRLSCNPALFCHRRPRTQVLRLRFFALLVSSQVQQKPTEAGVGPVQSIYKKGWFIVVQIHKLNNPNISKLNFRNTS